MRKLFLTTFYSILLAVFIFGVTALYCSYFPDPEKRTSKRFLEKGGLRQELMVARAENAKLTRLLSEVVLDGIAGATGEVHEILRPWIGQYSFLGRRGGYGGGGGQGIGGSGGGGGQGSGGGSGSGGRLASGDVACRESNLQLGIVLDERQPCVDIGKIVEGLAVGTYIFNKPETVYVGIPFRIALTLKTSNKQNVTPFFAGLPGNTTERSAKWSQSLEASLRGDEMTVKPEGGQDRTATKSGPVSWEWTITPQAGGKKTIVIEVAANILVGDKRNKVQIETLREPIEVTVSNFERVKAYVAGANAFALALPPALIALVAIAGFVPPIRKAIRQFWRWLTRRGRQSRSG